MGDQKPEAVRQASLSDSDIVTERRVHRRAFLSASGMFLAGGAVAVVAGARALAQEGRPTDPPPPSDNVSDDEKRRRRREREREERERQRGTDPNQPPPTDQTPPQ